jgi:hypothetical protein
MAWITPPVFVALQTLTDSVMNQLSSRLSDLWVGTTAGDTDYYSASDTKTRLALGSAGQYLGVTGSAPAWKDDGVPGLFTTAGDIPYGTGANASSRLGIGVAGQTMQTNSGATAPEWTSGSRAQLTRATTQSINNSSYTPVSFSSATFDTDSYWSAGAPTKLTLPAGFFLIRGHIAWAIDATNLRESKIYLNGSPISRSSNVKQAVSGVSSTNTSFLLIELSSSVYIELNAWQNSGGALNVNSGASFTVTKIGAYG